MSTKVNTSETNTADQTIVDGAELKRMLRVSGYSQREVAQYIGYSRSYINNVCNELSPLTLRVTAAVRRLLGDELYRLALVRARQVMVDEERRYQEEQRFRKAEAEYQRQQMLLREEERRQGAIATLKEQLEGAEVETSAMPLAADEAEPGVKGQE